jgi:hypothetical protein
MIQTINFENRQSATDNHLMTRWTDEPILQGLSQLAQNGWLC